jgi:hypothetical protein
MDIQVGRRYFAGLLLTASARPLHSLALFYDSKEVGLREQDVERVLEKAVTLEALPTIQIPRKSAPEVRLWIVTELLHEGQIRQELPSTTLQTVPEEDGQARGVSPRVLHLDGYGKSQPLLLPDSVFQRLQEVIRSLQWYLVRWMLG